MLLILGNVARLRYFICFHLWLEGAALKFSLLFELLLLHDFQLFLELVLELALVEVVNLGGTGDRVPLLTECLRVCKLVQHDRLTLNLLTHELLRLLVQLRFECGHIDFSLAPLLLFVEIQNYAAVRYIQSLQNKVINKIALDRCIGTI